jgi:hypothetical protein
LPSPVVRRRAERKNPVDMSEGARLVRIDDLRSCLAVAFERLDLTPRTLRDWAGSWSTPSFAAIPTTESPRSGFSPPSTARAS